jgi:hypothetical protein
MRICPCTELFLKKRSNGTKGEHDLRATCANWTAQRGERGEDYFSKIKREL